MKKFRLEKLLDHHHTQEQLAQQELAIARKRWEKLRLEVAAARARLVAGEEEFENNQRIGLAPQEFILHQEHLDRLTKRLAKLNKQLQLAHQDVESRRVILIQASKNKHLVQKLKEKWHEQFKQEQLNKENLVLDEIALRQFQSR